MCVYWQYFEATVYNSVFVLILVSK
jgi:hypothetical protein